MSKSWHMLGFLLGHMVYYWLARKYQILRLGRAEKTHSGHLESSTKNTSACLATLC